MIDSTSPPRTSLPRRRPFAPTGGRRRGAPRLPSGGPGINDNGSGSQNLEIALQMAKLGITATNQVVFAWWGVEESGLIGSQFYVDSLDGAAGEGHGGQPELRHGRFAELRPLRVRRRRPTPTRSPRPVLGVVEDVFLDYFASQEPCRADGLRRPLRLRTRSSASGFAGGTFTGAEEIKTPTRLRSTAGRPSRVRPLLPPGLRDHRQPLEHGARPDGGAAAHAVLVFAQTTSAIEGTDKGKGKGKPPSKPSSRARR